MTTKRKETAGRRLHLVPSWAPVLTEARDNRDAALLRYESERRVVKGVWQMCLFLAAVIAVGWWLS